jgi:flavodoxin
MRVAILYCSTHGKTKKAVAEVLRHLEIHPDVYSVENRPPQDVFRGYDLLAFFCPTYGDEELQEDMESFLQGFQPDLKGKQFVICELGNYYGYDNFSFGAMRIIRHHLLALGGTELCEPLSLDSLPKTHWGHLLDWVDYLNGKIAKYERP